MSAGLFANSRRGGLTAVDRCDILAAYRGDGGARPVGVQALANRYGASMEDIRLIVNPETAQALASRPRPVLLEGWPFNACDDAHKEIVRAAARRHGVSLLRMNKVSRKDPEAIRARSEALYDLSCAGLGMVTIGTIIGRDHSVVSTFISRHRASLTQAAA